MKIGIDIGGSHIAIGLVDDRGNILTKIEQDIQIKENMEEYVVDIVDKAIEKICKTADIQEIGIAVPGNPTGTVITNLVNLNINRIDFKVLEEKYKVRVKCINDGKAAGLAEKVYGAMKGYKDCVFLCLGTGIGGAVFLNDTLLKANKNVGFELGHMIIDRNGIECNCGKKGCFETYCSIKRLKDRLRIQLDKIIPGVQIEDSKTLKKLVESNKDNEKIKAILDEYMDDLIVGLSNIIDIFEPEIICLGGSFVYFKDLLCDKLIDRIMERRYVFNKNSLPKIELAKLQNDAGIIGATLI